MISCKQKDYINSNMLQRYEMLEMKRFYCTYSIFKTVFLTLISSTAVDIE